MKVPGVGYSSVSLKDALYSELDTYAKSIDRSVAWVVEKSWKQFKKDKSEVA